MVQHRRHQAGRPDFAVTDDFGIYRVSDAAIQQPGKTLKILNKRGDQRIGSVWRQQSRNEIHLITTERLLHLMRREAIGLAELQPADQLVGGTAGGRDDHHIARLRILRHDTRDAQVTFRIR